MDELLNDICFMLQSVNKYDELTRQRLVILMSRYKIERASTEVAIYEGDVNEKLINTFLLNKKVKGCTERTIQSYDYTLKFIAERLENDFLNASSNDIKVYLAKRKVMDGISDVYVGNEWRILSSFYGWMHREEIIQVNPMYKVDKPKKRKQKKKAFSEREIELLRNSCKTERDKALIEVMLSTWCRVSEISGMNISDIEGNQMVILGKGQKERVVYINARAQIAIDNYIKSRTDNNDALFVTKDRPHERLKPSGIEMSVRSIGNEAGVTGAHPHRFRRTGATMALKSGMPILLVSQILGHDSVDTTQIYLDINEDELKHAHEKYVR